MNSSTPIYFINKKQALCKVDSLGAVQNLTGNNFATNIAVSAEGHFWVIRKNHLLSHSPDGTEWFDISTTKIDLKRIEATPAGNAIVMATDGSLFGIEQNGKSILLAPAGYYNDFSVSADGILWLVTAQVGEKENVLAWTTLQELRPQPLWSGAMGQRVAADKNGKVGFITLGGEVASCDPYSMGNLCSDAGKVFGKELCIDSISGTYYVLKEQKKGKGGKVVYWNPEKDDHNSWKVLKEVEALAIAVP